MKRLFVIIFLMLTSCSYMPTKMTKDDSILTNSNCNLPCWHGIIIGSTTKQEVLDILSRTSIVDQDTITTTKSNVLFSEKIFFKMGKGSVTLKLDNGETVEQGYLWSGEISILDNKVAQIVLSGNLDISIQQIIDIFGEPTSVVPFYTTGGHIWVEMTNPSRGLDFGYRADGLNSNMAANTTIDSIMLFNPELYEEMVKNKMFLYLHQGPSDIDDYIWRGYGDLIIYWQTE